MRLLLTLLTVTGLLVAPAAATADRPDRVRPLAQAHAHNDYEHDRPLHDALDHGFTSVEADIYLVGGELLVGHDPQDLAPGRTLRALYLEPLRDRVRANHGKVYPGRPAPFQLLIDLKNTGAATYTQLDRELRDPRYAFLFTRYTDGKVKGGPVTAVVSGDRPRDLMAAQRDRLAFYDGRLVGATDLGGDAEFVPLVSDNWTKVFTWTGAGTMPAAERDRLRSIVATAHAADQRVRFWATPDQPGPERTAIWRELAAAGVTTSTPTTSRVWRRSCGRTRGCTSTTSTCPTTPPPRRCTRWACGPTAWRPT
ncbi:phosphatidylinositol-specific phospholipase C/glycerophosphodiester phosphodiesterase family protein [Actinokineospora sp.]|uniref:phosphatidylinositol-specific phospholipase C/glycerophosphodiester phosphodiesterase family protein n=1 Tax=Actinokineospora sp. TaxID=1872133 RepID=UPI004037DB53